MLEADRCAVVEEEMTLKLDFIQSCFEGSAEIDPGELDKRMRGRYEVQHKASPIITMWFASYATTVVTPVTGVNVLF